MYEDGVFGDYAPAESIAPDFADYEERLIYYTLPMALNYRRPSFQLWSAAKESYLDPQAKPYFNLKFIANLPSGSPELQHALSIHKLAMQPTRHPVIWYTIASIISTEWGSIEGLLQATHYDFLELRDLVQERYKKHFPYLSGPKLFNFWCYILGVYCQVDFKNKHAIDIAVDSHIRRASVVLGVVSEQEVQHLSVAAIADRWRKTLGNSEIAPVDLNVPLWFWSRSGFVEIDRLDIDARALV